MKEIFLYISTLPRHVISCTKGLTNPSPFAISLDARTTMFHEYFRLACLGCRRRETRFLIISRLSEKKKKNEERRKEKLFHEPSCSLNIVKGYVWFEQSCSLSSVTSSMTSLPRPLRLFVSSCWLARNPSSLAEGILYCNIYCRERRAYITSVEWVTCQADGEDDLRTQPP